MALNRERTAATRLQSTCLLGFTLRLLLGLRLLTGPALASASVCACPLPSEAAQRTLDNKPREIMRCGDDLIVWKSAHHSLARQLGE